MSPSPRASGDEAQTKSAPSPNRPTSAYAQDVRAERAALLHDFMGEALEPVERDALDHLHLEEIARLSDLASSYSKSVSRSPPAGATSSPSPSIADKSRW